MQAGGLLSSSTMFILYIKNVSRWLDYIVGVFVCNFCAIKVLFEPGVVEFRAKRASTPCRYEPPIPPVVWFMKDGLQTHQWLWFTEIIRRYKVGSHLIWIGLNVLAKTPCNNVLWFILVFHDLKPCVQIISTVLSFSVMLSCRSNKCGYKGAHFYCVNVRI